MARQQGETSRAIVTVLADYGLLLLLAALFSSAFVWIALALPSYPPSTIVLLRQAIGAIFYVSAMFWLGQRLPPFGKVWVPICGLGVFGNALPFLLIAWGQEQVNAGLAAILISTTPIMALFVGQFVAKERTLTPLKILAVLVGLSGVVTIIGWDKLASFGDQQFRQFAILVAAVCYAINAYITKFLADQPRIPVIAGCMLASVIGVLPFSIVVDRPWTLDVGFVPSVAIILLAFFSTVAGNFLRFEIAGRRGALFLTQISYLIPLFGIFWAWLVLSEVPTASVYLATGLILAGIFIFRLSDRGAERKVLGLRNEGVES